MKTNVAHHKIRIAILGGGPSGLFLFKRLLEQPTENLSLEIEIFERKLQLGAGMPYSSSGANEEHITNVSDNEIPPIVNTIADWSKSVSTATLKRFQIDPENFNEYKVLPRLFFGQYLSAQFDLLLEKARAANISVKVHLGTEVMDIIDQPDLEETWVEVKKMGVVKFNKVVICTGHHWPKKHEDTVPGYFDAPYPPSKLNFRINHPVAIKGSSLTAIDAIRTIARNNGTFIKGKEGKLAYEAYQSNTQFKIRMHSRSGMLPAVRFHLENPRLLNHALLSPQEIQDHIKENDGFLSLDYVFEKNFKEIFRNKDPEFYQKIKNLSMEEFVAAMMALREKLDPFQLLSAEYAEAAKSINRKESVYWKEMLGVLSFAMNYPAKYLSAEDMQRLQNTLIPLISIVIAYVPQSSCEELLALSDAGILSMILVGEDSEVEAAHEKGGAIYHYTDEGDQKQSVHYQTFIDCVGQPHLSYAQFPFKSMIADKTISPAKIKFKSAGQAIDELAKGNDKIESAINDHFQVVDQFGAYNERIYIMSVPYIGGFNPDYSGLDFCEEASKRITERMFML